jgi:hypothetical protein
MEIAQAARTTAIGLKAPRAGTGEEALTGWAVLATRDAAAVLLEIGRGDDHPLGGRASQPGSRAETPRRQPSSVRLGRPGSACLRRSAPQPASPTGERMSLSCRALRCIIDRGPVREPSTKSGADRCGPPSDRGTLRQSQRGGDSRNSDPSAHVATASTTAAKRQAEAVKTRACQMAL